MIKKHTWKREYACVRVCVSAHTYAKEMKQRKEKGEHMEDMRAHSGDFKQTD